MTTKRVKLGVVTILLLVSLAAMVVVVVVQLGGASPAPAAELTATAEQNKQALLDGILAGKVLYLKEEQYKSEPVEPDPQHTIVETWMVADSDGKRLVIVGTKRDTEGKLLAYTEQRGDGAQTYTRLNPRETSKMPVPEYLSDIVDSLGTQWDALLAFEERPEYVFTQRGTHAGRPSLIYLRSLEGRAHTMEIVEHAPLLFKHSLYDSVILRDSTVVEWSAFTEYGLLPEGTSLPDPAAEAANL